MNCKIRAFLFSTSWRIVQKPTRAGFLEAQRHAIKEMGIANYPVQ